MTGLGWWPFSSEESGVEVGKRVLSAYYNQAVNFTEFPWTSYELWIANLNSKVPDFESVVGDLVKMNYASTTEAQAQDRLVELANQSSGEASPSQIVAAAGGRGDTINWSAAIPEIASESAADVTSVVQNVGKGVLGTLNMTKYLPWILLGAGALFIYTQGGALKGVIGSLRRNPRVRGKQLHWRSPYAHLSDAALNKLLMTKQDQLLRETSHHRGDALKRSRLERAIKNVLHELQGRDLGAVRREMRKPGLKKKRAKLKRRK